MQLLEFKVGDTCWIGMGHKHLARGKVIKVLDLTEEGWPLPQYLIEVAGSIDPVLEVRDGFTMSDTAEGPLGYSRPSKT